MTFKIILFAITLSFTIGVQGQENVLNAVPSFANTAAPTFHEKIFVHTDKSFYLAGELLWFKIYQADGYLNLPIDISKVSYVEVLSNDKKPVLQAKISMTSGTGSGSFFIPPSMPSGNYLLRAYTNWMKNFEPDLYFEKTITIVNPLKRPDWKSPAATSYHVEFFPEGGNLVAGLESKVAFQVTDQFGSGVSATGAIVDQNNDTAAAFQTVRFGIGSFVFAARPGVHYKAVLTVNGSMITKELPAVHDKGYVMHVESQANDQVRVTVTTNLNQPNEILYLVVHKKQKVQHALTTPVQNGRSTFTIDKKLCGEGVTYFTLFDGAGKPLCERLFFNRPSKKLNLEVKPGSNEYGIKELVNIDVSALIDSGKAFPANMSVSVFLLDSLQKFEGNDIFSHLWLGADLKGKIESPAYYCTNTGKEVDEAIDNLMLTHGWRRFDWSDSLAKKTALKYLPEYEGHIILGTLTNKRTGSPAGGVGSFLSIPAQRFEFSNSVSGEDGQLRFVANNFFGTEEIIVQTASKKDSGYRIDIASPFSQKVSNTVVSPFELSEKFKTSLVSRSIGIQSQNLYLQDSIRQFFLPRSDDTTNFYGIPDKEYKLDDYTRFITMEEVMREFVSEVRVRRQQDQFHFQVSNHPYKVFFEEDPLVLLDGVPVFDIGKMIAFDPLKIRKIDVVSQTYYHGPMVNYGIVSYQSYDGDLAGFQLDPSALVVEYEGLQLQRKFYSPNYGNGQLSNDRLPDFRNVLYWSPDVVTGANGKAQLSFYTSELPGTYGVVLQGITNNGYSGSGMTTFSVVNRGQQ